MASNNPTGKNQYSKGGKGVLPGAKKIASKMSLKKFVAKPPSAEYSGYRRTATATELKASRRIKRRGLK